MKKLKPGSPKGVPKPPKRALDDEFPRRLDAAMTAKGWDVPKLASEVGCTRAVLHKYRARTPGTARSKTIDAFLLVSISDKLGVSATWLLSGTGNVAAPKQLTPDEDRCLNIFSVLHPMLKELWLNQGEALRMRQPALIATNGNPYPSISPEVTN